MGRDCENDEIWEGRDPRMLGDDADYNILVDHDQNRDPEQPEIGDRVFVAQTRSGAEWESEIIAIRKREGRKSRVMLGPPPWVAETIEIRRTVLQAEALERQTTAAKKLRDTVAEELKLRKELAETAARRKAGLCPGCGEAADNGAPACACARKAVVKAAENRRMEEAQAKARAEKHRAADAQQRLAEKAEESKAAADAFFEAIDPERVLQEIIAAEGDIDKAAAVLECPEAVNRAGGRTRPGIVLQRWCRRPIHRRSALAPYLKAVETRNRVEKTEKEAWTRRQWTPSGWPRPAPEEPSFKKTVAERLRADPETAVFAAFAAKL